MVTRRDPSDVYQALLGCLQSYPRLQSGRGGRVFHEQFGPLVPHVSNLSRNPPKIMSELMTIIEKDCMHEKAIAEHLAPKVTKLAKPSAGTSRVKKQVATVKHDGQKNTGGKPIPAPPQQP